MNVQKVVVDTDLLVDHLLFHHSGERRPERSLFRLAASKFFCYTTVFNAVELFSACRSAVEVRAAEDVMHAIKLLGLNAKSARTIGPLFRRPEARTMQTLIAGICIESRLPLLTKSPRRYRGIPKLRVFDATRVLAE